VLAAAHKQQIHVPNRQPAMMGHPGSRSVLSLAATPAADCLVPFAVWLQLQGDPITLKVNKLMSVKNLPFEYYSLPYCRPDKIISSAENLGEVLRGDRIENSPYSVRLQLGTTAWSSLLLVPGFAARNSAALLSSVRPHPDTVLTWHRTVQAKFRVNHHCKVTCRIASLSKAQEKAFKSRISDEYRVNM
jgi:transmembrane 9 superfamily protein 2/4